MILVVDDEPAITELLTDVLEYHGHPVLVANDAETALDIMSFKNPDVILMDIMMPSVDGLSLALALRRGARGRDIPLIAMSASDSALELAGRVGDFDAALSKPFEHQELISLIERYISVPT